MQSIPTLIFLGLTLYVDRIVLREAIMDSSALTCTIFAAHVLNLCRSSIAHVDIPMHTHAYGSDVGEANKIKDAQNELMMSQIGAYNLSAYSVQAQNSSRHMHQELHTTREQQIWNHHVSEDRHTDSNGQQILLSWWQEDMIYMLYVLASVLLLMDIDVVSIILPSSPCATAQLVKHNSSSSTPFAHQSHQLKRTFSHQSAILPSGGQQQLRQQAARHYDRRDYYIPYSYLGGTGNSNIISISTVVTHCVLISIILQMSVDKNTFMTPVKVMVRSFLFTGLCICWTYVVGINDACIAIREFPYYVNPILQQFQGTSWQDSTYVDTYDEEISYNHATTKPPVLTNASMLNSCRRKRAHGHSQQTSMYAEAQATPQAAARQGSADPTVASSTSYVQGFTPCQLRFTVLLFSDSWHMPLAAFVMCAVMAEKLHSIARCSIGNNPQGTQQLPIPSQQALTNHANGRRPAQHTDPSNASNARQPASKYAAGMTAGML